MTSVLVVDKPLVRLDELDVGMTFLHEGHHYVNLTIGKGTAGKSAYVKYGLRLVASLPDFMVYTLGGEIEVEPTACEMKITEVHEGCDFIELES